MRCAALLLCDVVMNCKRKDRCVFTSSQVEELVVIIYVVVSSDLSLYCVRWEGGRYLFSREERSRVE